MDSPAGDHVVAFLRTARLPVRNHFPRLKRVREINADQRLDELAAILAAGVLRLYGRSGDSAACVPSSAEFPRQAGPQGLELSGTSRLTVTPR